MAGSASQRNERRDGGGAGDDADEEQGELHRDDNNTSPTPRLPVYQRLNCDSISNARYL